MSRISKKSNFSTFSCKTAWKKTVTSEGTEKIIYDLYQTDEIVDYFVSNGVLQVKTESKDCRNPLSAIIEIADAAHAKKSTELVVQQFFKRFGFFTPEKTIQISHDEIMKIAVHYKLLLTILREYYKIGTNYTELFRCCVEYYLLHSKFTLDIRGIELEPEDDYFHSLFNIIPIWFHGWYMAEIKGADTIEDKVKKTVYFLTHTSMLTGTKLGVKTRAETVEAYLAEKKAKENEKDPQKLLLRQMTEANAASLGHNLDGPEPPEILLLMRSIYNKLPYYIDDGKVCFVDDEVGKGILAYASKIKSVAKAVILHAIGDMDMKIVFNVAESKCTSNIDSLKCLMDYSLMMTNHIEYCYYPCDNQKCVRYALRLRPEKNSQSDDNQKNHYCCIKCARNTASREYDARKKVIGG